MGSETQSVGDEVIIDAVLLSEACTLHVAAAGSDDAEVDGVCRWSRQATHHVW